MSYTYPARPRFSFQAKIVLTVAGVAAGDWLFWAYPIGSALGAAALAWTICTLALHREVRRDRAALVAASLAGIFALVLIDQPGVPAWLMFWSALSLAVLLPRARFDDAWRWFQRLAFHGLVATVGPLLDGLRLRKLRRKAKRRPLGEAVTVVAAPLIGGAIFLALFSLANPLISRVLENLRLPPFDLIRSMFWGLMLVTVWGAFRPRRLRRPLRFTSPPSAPVKPHVGILSVTLSLLVFNALFALQNGLDIAFLWSGAPLPKGVTLADYAHRGAYPLIATALLAGLFVLVALRPGSPTAQSKLIRRLVTVWVIQNVFLVASSVLRTLDYIDAYSLTRMRIAALAWMGLVALGLVLIIWRLLRNKSAAWLINGNALAAAIVLAVSSALDFGAISAAWNVRHAREVGGHGVGLDLCYMRGVGSGALIPLAELQRRPLPPAFAARVRNVRQDLAHDTYQDQHVDWRAWTWRDQRRLDQSQAIAPIDIPQWRNNDSCDGAPYPTPKPPLPPAPVAPPATPTPLTSSQPS
jgi:hypothetical protein